MHKDGSFLEIAAMVCTIPVAVLAIADWFVKDHL
jgi:hypothetical protein